MPTTNELRSLWAPPCKGPFTRVALYGAGIISIKTQIVPAVNALNAALVKWTYKTRAADTGAYNCRHITGGTGYSLHAYGIAIDINWQSNPYGSVLKTDMPAGMIAAIKAIRTNNGKQVWGWGGDYKGNKDAMHFEVVCSPADIATGINPSTVPSSTVPIPPENPTQENDEMKIIAPTQGPDAGKAFLCGNGKPFHIPTPRQFDELVKIYGPAVSVSDVTWDVIKATF